MPLLAIFGSISTGGSTSFTLSATSAVAVSTNTLFGNRVDVTMFGATGDGSTDDTAAIQAAINSATTAQLACSGIYFPDGTYKLTSAINIGTDNTLDFVGLHIYGESRGGTNLVQHTNNTPIFQIAPSLMHSCNFERFNASWPTLQSASSTASSVFRFIGTDTSDFFNSKFSDIGAQNFYYFIDAPGVLYWGNHMDNMFLGDLYKGVTHITGDTGEPRCYFTNIYIGAQSCIGTLFDNQSTYAKYDNIEINGANAGCTMLADEAGGAHIIGHWALEDATYNSDVTLFDVINGIMTFDYIYTNDIAIGAGAHVYFCNWAGLKSYVHGGVLNVGFNTNSGTYICTQGSGPLQASFYNIFAPWSAGCRLADVGNSAAANFTEVRQWNDPGHVVMQGDASVSISAIDAVNQIFDVPLTANRTVTLPDEAADSTNVLFLGRRFRFAKTNTSNFSLTVKTASGTTVFTIPSATAATKEIIWHRDGGANADSWVVLP